MSREVIAVKDQDVEANCTTSQIRDTFSEILLLPWWTKVPPPPVEPRRNRTGILELQRKELEHLYKTIYFESDESLCIKVGTGINATRWRVRKSLICHYSQFFKTACESGLAESQSNNFVLPEDSPAAFGLFVEWMHTWNKAALSVLSVRTYINKKLGTPPSSWCRNSHLAWILADKLLAPEFSKFALANFISHSICIRNEKTFRFIQDNTMENSALAGYVRKWKQHQITNDIMEDPRKCEIDHWYMSCSRNIEERCRHQHWFAKLREHQCLRKDWILLLLLGLFFLGALIMIIYFACGGWKTLLAVGIGVGVVILCKTLNVTWG